MDDTTEEETTVKSYWDEKWAVIEVEVPQRASIHYVSNYGRIKSYYKQTKIEKLLKGSHGRQGHHMLNIKMGNGVRKGNYVHRLVGKYFIEKPSEDHKYLVHLDQDRLNNHYQNLKWVTREELNERWKDLELYKESKFKHSSIKMTESKVRLLKERLKKGKTKKKILAKQFNISVTQVNRIESGENWGHIKVDD